ncbi:uncharacterized protein LOC101891017 [Musca domestica]|uniref:Uncharacterized protein LOC101891017 n=1 Tax=Musca domestica TaxID=7370 RepID=A0A9J7I5C6_MUSDO|nr:uncharacterized protein LOC101891017 [Musca domestica]
MGTSIALVCYCCSNAYKYLCNHKLWTFFRNTTSNIQHFHTTNRGRRRERKQQQQQQQQKMMMKMGLFSKIQVLLIFIGICQVMSLAWAKPLEEGDMIMGDTEPIYEYQMVAWPTDLEDDDIVDVLDDDDEDLEGDFVTSGNKPSQHDELDTDAEPPLPEEDQDPVETVHVLENYHNTFANGTEEIKLVMSNGHVNYQRIELKEVGGELLPVQDGYFTVPVDGSPRTFQTTYYHADEKGYNVYKTEQTVRNPAHDVYLEYIKTDQETVK